MNIYKRYVVFSVSILLLTQIAIAQQQPPAAPSLVTSLRPLEDASRRLQEKYGKVVTYEEPVLTWRGDLQTQPGWTGGSKWELFPATQSFLMPESGPGADLASILENTIAAYHQQTSGTRFRLLSSKWGYHIAPVQMHDENGRSVPAASALDQIITVPSEGRTARTHLLAIGTALNSTGPIHVDISAVPGKADGFDRAFRAQPEVFQWGVHSVTARDALIDLLNQSATTFSWRLMCQASAQASDRFCALNVGAIEVAITDSQGKPVKQVLWFDR